MSIERGRKGREGKGASGSCACLAKFADCGRQTQLGDLFPFVLLLSCVVYGLDL